MKANRLGIMVALSLMLSATTGTAWAAGEETTLTTQATQMDTYTASKGQTAVTSKTAADFSKFYGEANSQALAEGLRTGGEIKLTNPTPSGSTATTGATATTASTATFTPPTGSMGNGNVYISMALAQQQLTAAGITQPTAEQIQAAMMGGTLTTGGQPVQGVLQMRASGMGWGQIAKAYGTKLGPVISGMKSANTAISRTTATTGTTPTTAAGTTTTATGKTKGAAATTKATTGSGKSGIVTGAGGGANVVGGTKGSSGKSGIVTGAGGTAGGKSGIVTGAGGAGGASSAAGGAQGHGAGIVTGGAGAGGGGGQGKGYGKGGK